MRGRSEEEEEMEMEEEEEETHNIDDLLESETKGEVDRFTVVEHRTLQAVNDVTFSILTTII